MTGFVQIVDSLTELKYLVGEWVEVYRAFLEATPVNAERLGYAVRNADNALLEWWEKHGDG